MKIPDVKAPEYYCPAGAAGWENGYVCGYAAGFHDGRTATDSPTSVDGVGGQDAIRHGGAARQLLVACKAVKHAIENDTSGSDNCLWIMPPYQGAAVHETSWDRLARVIDVYENGQEAPTSRGGDAGQVATEPDGNGTDGGREPTRGVGHDAIGSDSPGILWIPVSERLPGDGVTFSRTVLVVLDWRENGGSRSVGMDRYVHDTKRWEKTLDGDAITHWARMPDPPDDSPGILPETNTFCSTCSEPLKPAREFAELDEKIERYEEARKAARTCSRCGGVLGIASSVKATNAALAYLCPACDLGPLTLAEFKARFALADDDTQAAIYLGLRHEGQDA